MTPTVRNLFTVEPGDAEHIQTLVKTPGLTLEHIASFGDRSEDGFWYDQTTREWVMLAQGSATLVFDPGGAIDLVAGDALTIEPHHRHRVERTSQDAVWIAVHLEP